MRDKPLLSCFLLSGMLLGGGALAAAPAPRLQIVGVPERLAPDRISRGFDELQATTHPKGQLVLWGCSNCRAGQGTDVMLSQIQNGAWSGPNHAHFVRSHNEQSPTFSADGQWLYFVSDRGGGFGGTDLYRIYYAAHRNKFMTPENLGPSINSAGDEGAATATADGLAVIFASKGRKGARGWDLFYSRRAGGRMTPGEALPDRINTRADEFDPALIGDVGLVFARSEDFDSEPASLWFAAKSADGYAEPVRLDDSVNTPGASVRAAAQDLAQPDHLLFTRSSSDPAHGVSDIYRVRFRIVSE